MWLLDPGDGRVLRGRGVVSTCILIVWGNNQTDNPAPQDDQGQPSMSRLPPVRWPHRYDSRGNQSSIGRSHRWHMVSSDFDSTEDVPWGIGETRRVEV